MRSPSEGSMRSPSGLLRRLLPVSFAVALTLTFGTVDAWAKANPAPPAKVEAKAESTAMTRARVVEALGFVPVALDDDLVEYAQREVQTLGLEDFHGGDVVIIGSTGLVILLLVILILVLV
jgi:hypothetical protein